jgi:hypothetical protein
MSDLQLLKEKITNLFHNLRAQNLKVGSSNEYLRLKKAFYRLSIKLGLNPRLKLNVLVSTKEKKTLTKAEKTFRTKIHSVHVLSDLIYDLKIDLKKNKIIFASSAEYRRLVKAYYRLTKKLGVESSLKLIKSKSRPYDDLSIAERVEFEKGVDVEAIDRQTLKKGDQDLREYLKSTHQPYSSAKLSKSKLQKQFESIDGLASVIEEKNIISETPLQILNSALDRLFSQPGRNFSEAQKRNISRDAFEHLKNNGEVEIDERTFSDYGCDIKQVALAAESNHERYLRITKQLRANYVLNKNCGRLKGFFDTAEKKKARQIAINNFLKGEARDFLSEDLLDSEILNDFQPEAANPSSFSEVSIRLQEEILFAAAEFSRLKNEYHNEESVSDELWNSYWASDAKQTQLKFKLHQLERAEEVLDIHLGEALKSCLESDERALRAQLEIGLGSLTPHF